MFIIYFLGFSVNTNLASLKQNLTSFSIIIFGTHMQWYAVGPFLNVVGIYINSTHLPLTNTGLGLRVEPASRWFSLNTVELTDGAIFSLAMILLNRVVMYFRICLQWHIT